MHLTVHQSWRYSLLALVMGLRTWGAAKKWYNLLNLLAPESTQAITAREINVPSPRGQVSKILDF